MQEIYIKNISYKNLKKMCDYKNIVFKEMLSMNELKSKIYFKEFIGENSKALEDFIDDSAGFGEFTGTKQYFITDLDLIGLADMRDCGLDFITIYAVKVNYDFSSNLMSDTVLPSPYYKKG